MPTQDFYVSFGSNASTFAGRLKTQLKDAEAALTSFNTALDVTDGKLRTTTGLGKLLTQLSSNGISVGGAPSTSATARDSASPEAVRKFEGELASTGELMRDVATHSNDVISNMERIVRQLEFAIKGFGGLNEAQREDTRRGKIGNAQGQIYDDRIRAGQDPHTSSGNLQSNNPAKNLETQLAQRRQLNALREVDRLIGQSAQIPEKLAKAAATGPSYSTKVESSVADRDLKGIQTRIAQLTRQLQGVGNISQLEAQLKAERANPSPPPTRALLEQAPPLRLAEPATIAHIPQVAIDEAVLNRIATGVGENVQATRAVGTAIHELSALLARGAVTLPQHAGGGEHVTPIGGTAQRVLPPGLSPELDAQFSRAGQLRGQITKRQRLTALGQVQSLLRSGQLPEVKLFKTAAGGSEGFVEDFKSRDAERISGRLAKTIASVTKELEGVPRLKQLKAQLKREVESLEAQGYAGGRRPKQFLVERASGTATAATATTGVAALATGDSVVAKVARGTKQDLTEITGARRQLIKERQEDLQKLQTTLANLKAAKGAPELIAQTEAKIADVEDQIEGASFLLRADRREHNRSRAETVKAAEAEYKGLDPAERRRRKGLIDRAADPVEFQQAVDSRRVLKPKLLQMRAAYEDEGYGLTDAAGKRLKTSASNQHLAEALIRARGQYVDSGGTTTHDLTTSRTGKVTEVAYGTRQILNQIYNAAIKTAEEVESQARIRADRLSGGELPSQPRVVGEGTRGNTYEGGAPKKGKVKGAFAGDVTSGGVFGGNTLDSEGRSRSLPALDRKALEDRLRRIDQAAVDRLGLAGAGKGGIPTGFISKFLEQNPRYNPYDPKHHVTGDDDEAQALRQAQAAFNRILKAFDEMANNMALSPAIREGVNLRRQERDPLLAPGAREDIAGRKLDPRITEEGSYAYRAQQYKEHREDSRAESDAPYGATRQAFLGAQQAFGAKRGELSSLFPGLVIDRKGALRALDSFQRGPQARLPEGFRGATVPTFQPAQLLQAQGALNKYVSAFIAAAELRKKGADPAELAKAELEADKRLTRFIEAYEKAANVTLPTQSKAGPNGEQFRTYSVGIQQEALKAYDQQQKTQRTRLNNLNKGLEAGKLPKNVDPALAQSALKDVQTRIQSLSQLQKDVAKHDATAQPVKMDPVYIAGHNAEKAAQKAFSELGQVSRALKRSNEAAVRADLDRLGAKELPKGPERDRVEAEAIARRDAAINARPGLQAQVDAAKAAYQPLAAEAKRLLALDSPIDKSRRPLEASARNLGIDSAGALHELIPQRIEQLRAQEALLRGVVGGAPVAGGGNGRRGGGGTGGTGGGGGGTGGSAASGGGKDTSVLQLILAELRGFRSEVRSKTGKTAGEEGTAHAGGGHAAKSEDAATANRRKRVTQQYTPEAREQFKTVLSSAALGSLEQARTLKTEESRLAAAASLVNEKFASQKRAVQFVAEELKLTVAQAEKLAEGLKNTTGSHALLSGGERGAEAAQRKIQEDAAARADASRRLAPTVFGAAARSQFLDSVSGTGTKEGFAAVRAVAAARTLKTEESRVEAAVTLVNGKFATQARAVQLIAEDLRLTVGQAAKLSQAVNTRVSAGSLQAGAAAAAAANNAALVAAEEERQRLERKEQTVAQRTNSRAQSAGNATAALARLSQATKNEVAELGRLVAAGAKEEQQTAQLRKAWAALNAELLAGNFKASERRKIGSDVFGAQGYPISGKGLERIAPDTGSLQGGAKQAGGDYGDAMSEGASNAFFGPRGFFGSVLRSGGHFVVRNFSASIVFGLTSALQSAVEAGVNTESTFVRVSSALESTGRSVGDLRTDLLGLSQDYGVSLQGVYQTTAGLAGLFDSRDQGNKQLLELTKTAAQLEIISGGALSATEAVRSLSSVTGAYSETSIKEIADVATVIQNRLGTNVEDTMEGVARLSGETKELGINFQHAAVYVAQIAKLTGQGGAGAGEQFQRILAVMQTGRVQKVLEEAFARPKGLDPATGKKFEGVQLGRDFAKGNYESVLDKILGNFGKLSEAQKGQVAYALSAGRQAGALFALLEQGPKVLETLTATTNAHGAAQERAAAMSRTLSREVAKLHTAFVDFFAVLAKTGVLNSLGVALAVVGASLRIINTTLSGLTNMLDSNSLTHIFKEWGLGLLGFLAIVAVARRALSGFGASFRNLRTGGGAAATAGAAPAILPSGTVIGATPAAAPAARYLTNSQRALANARGMTPYAFQQTDLQRRAFAESNGYALRRNNVRDFGRLDENGVPVGRAQRAFAVTSRRLDNIAESRSAAAAERSVAATRAATEGEGLLATARQRGLQATNAAAAGTARAGAATSAMLARASRGVVGVALAGTLVYALIDSMVTDAKEANQRYKALYDATYPSTPSANKDPNKTGSGENTKGQQFRELYKQEDNNFGLSNVISEGWQQIGNEINPWADGNGVLDENARVQQLSGSTQAAFHQQGKMLFAPGNNKTFKFGPFTARKQMEGPADVQKALKAYNAELDADIAKINASGADARAKDYAVSQIENTRSFIEDLATNTINNMNGIKEVNRFSRDQLSNLTNTITSVAGINANVRSQYADIVGMLGQNQGYEGIAATSFAALSNPNSSRRRQNRAQIEVTKAALNYQKGLLKTDLEFGSQNTAADFQTAQQLLQSLSDLENQSFEIPLKDAQQAVQLFELRGNFTQAIGRLRAQLPILRRQLDAHNISQPEFDVQQQQIYNQIATDRMTRADRTYDSAINNITAQGSSGANTAARRAELARIQLQQAQTDYNILISTAGSTAAIAKVTTAIHSNAMQQATVLNEITNTQLLIQSGQTRGYEGLLIQQDEYVLQILQRQAKGLQDRLKGLSRKVGSPQQIRDQAAKLAGMQGASADADAAGAQEAFDKVTASMETALARIAPGDLVAVARQRLAIAVRKQSYAAQHYGKDSVQYQQATQEIINDQRAITDAVTGVAEANTELAIAYATAAGDTVKVARLQIGLAQQKLNDALRKSGGNHNTVEVRQAEAGLINAQAGLNDALQQVAESRSNLAIAYAEAAGHTVDVARLQLNAARQKLREALRKSGGVETTDVRNARADAVKAEAGLRDAKLQDSLGTIDFNLEMGTMTKNAAIAALQQMLKATNLTREERRNIMLKIKGLQDDIRNTLTSSGFNIPGGIKLPTPYEVRRTLGIDKVVRTVREALDNNTAAKNAVATTPGAPANNSQNYREVVSGLQSVVSAVNAKGAQNVKVDMKNHYNVPTAHVAQQIAAQVVAIVERQMSRHARANTSTPRIR